MAKKEESNIKIISQNRKARQRFAILEIFEAGISLFGHEVKSLRRGSANIEEGFVRIDGNQIYLMNVYIPPYPQYTLGEYEPTRTRKLLMHRKEIDHLNSELQLKGCTIVPTELYFKRGIAKVQIGLAKGKKTEDRREEIKKRETDREIRRHFKA